MQNFILVVWNNKIIIITSELNFYVCSNAIDSGNNHWTTQRQEKRVKEDENYTKT